MFKDEYQRINDSIHASEALMHRTLRAAQKSRRRSRLTLLLAAAFCLLAVLAAPHLLRPHSTPDVTTQSTDPAAGEDFTPIRHSTEFDGLALRYLTSYHTDGSTFILLSLQGEGVSEEMSLKLGLTSEKTGQTFGVGATQLNHDADRQQSTFLVALHNSDKQNWQPIILWENGFGFPSEAYEPARFASLPGDDRLTLTLLQYTHILYKPMGETLPLADLPTSVTTVTRNVDSVYILPEDDPYWQHTTPEDHRSLGQHEWHPSYYTDKQVLIAGDAICEPFEGFRIVAAGFDGDHLRIQSCLDSRYRATNPNLREVLTAGLYLVPTSIPSRPWKNGLGLEEGILSPAAQYSWADEALGGRCVDYRYDVSRAELLSPYRQGWQLCALGFRTFRLLDTAHTLSFTIGE